MRRISLWIRSIGVPVEKYTLYGRAGSGSDVIRMLLEEIGVPYDFIPISRDPAAVEQYRRINPTGKVPALVLPQGLVMIESAAICLHLAASHADARLAPAPGTIEHARFLQWMVYLSANLYECALRIYYPARYSRAAESAAEGIKQRADEDFIKILSLIVPALSPYVLGQDISAADYYLYVIGGWYPQGRGPLHAQWPALAQHTRLLASRSSVRKVEADQAT
jgi:glutathione S-transferase